MLCKVEPKETAATRLATEDAQRVLTDLLDPRKIPDPRDALRAADAVRDAREAAECLGLHVEDAAGAAALWLAARMDTGSSILDGEREKFTHCVAMALLLRTSWGQELLHEAKWWSSLFLSHYDRLAMTYSRFRTWLDEVTAEFRMGETPNTRVRLVMAAARSLAAPDNGDCDVARMVSSHGRGMPVEPGDVPGALWLARGQGARVDGLLRRTPEGLRWVERKARDLVEQVTPRRGPVDGAMPIEEGWADPAPDPLSVAKAADLFDQIAEVGDATDRAITEGRRRGETDRELGQRLGMSDRAVNKRRHDIEERFDRLLG